jgi:hypothetical protein
LIIKISGPLTQPVEYLPFKQRVVGSNPTRPTKKAMRPHRLAWSRTPAFHAGDTGSNPVGDAIRNQGVRQLSLTPLYFIPHTIPHKRVA